ncbi:unnamed protein product [Phytophthora fragariaefolia]|uniref:Unnamed protein product n=1 Tax=Phytophthora fragariaefolia TaxID=1490495 RepID=A0A9W6YPC0_9STRA|nr:unnamed protein product [Phytophthora fragariaefolia]
MRKVTKIKSTIRGPAPKKKKATMGEFSPGANTLKTNNPATAGKNTQQPDPAASKSIKWTVQLTAVAIEARFRNKRILQNIFTMNSNTKRSVLCGKIPLTYLSSAPPPTDFLLDGGDEHSDGSSAEGGVPPRNYGDGIGRVQTPDSGSDDEMNDGHESDTDSSESPGEAHEARERAKAAAKAKRQRGAQVEQLPVTNALQYRGASPLNDLATLQSAMRYKPYTDEQRYRILAMLNPIENVFLVFKSEVKYCLATHRDAILRPPPGVTKAQHRANYMLRAAKLSMRVKATPELCDSAVMPALWTSIVGS